MKLEFPIVSFPDKELLRNGERLFQQPTEFIKGVVGMEHLPSDDRVEFCFAGRSNVGKSSLINAITNRKNLARTSSTPGRTQEINFFSIGDAHYMVDLPGYGFAKAPVETVKKWQRLLKQYLKGRVNLRRVFLLIDSRHGAKDVDAQIMTLLGQAAVSFQVVMTKADKVGKSELQNSLQVTRDVLQKHPAAFPELLVISSEKREGISELKAVIASLE